MWKRMSLESRFVVFWQLLSLVKSNGYLYMTVLVASGIDLKNIYTQLVC